MPNLEDVLNFEKPMRAADLNERNRQIALYVALGKTNEQIAGMLELSGRFVGSGFRSVMNKWDVRNRTQVALIAWRKYASEQVPGRTETLEQACIAEIYMRPNARLTGVEKEIINGLTVGLSNEEIATLRSVSKSTTVNEVRRLMAKLGLENRTQVAIYGAIQTRLAGQQANIPDLFSKLLEDLANGTDAGPDLADREKDVALRLALGYSNARIASELSLRENTVKTYIRGIAGKLGVRSRFKIGLFAFLRYHNKGAFEYTLGPKPDLTGETEIETLRLLTYGHSNEEIAQIRGRRTNTVKLDVSSLNRTLNCSNRMHNAVLGILHGYGLQIKLEQEEPGIETSYRLK